MSIEGICIYPRPNKKPCGKPTTEILDSNGQRMAFCAEHYRAIQQWITDHAAGRSTGKVGHFKMGKVVRTDRGRNKRIIL